MLVLIAGLVWLLVVCWLLYRILKQFRAYRMARLVTASPGTSAPSVGVVIPARDKSANITDCVTAIVGQDYAPDRIRVVVVDDESTDDTAERVRRLAQKNGRIAIVQSDSLPLGWLGKPRACWLGALSMRSDWLCFVDADVRAEPRLISSAVAVAEARGIDLLSVHPFQVLGSLWERLIITAGMLMIACAKPVPGADEQNRQALAVNGQFILIRAETYHAINGHAAVRDAVCEDVALAGLAQTMGFRVAVLSGQDFARTRMYRDFAALWEGFTKNAVEILGCPVRTLAAAILSIVVACTAPVLPVLLAVPAWRDPTHPAIAGLVAGVTGSAIVLAVQFGTLRHFRASGLLLPLFPLGVTMAAMIAIESIRRRRAGLVSWKGRLYSSSVRSVLS